MSTHKHFDKICCVVLVLTLILTVLFMNAEHFGVQKASTVMGYEKMLFDTSKVHTINIIMDDWDEFTASCMNKEYFNCTVVIDNKAYKNVAIRGKGNTSLTQVESYGNDRYSFKIEFDHYDSSNNYYGLDKLCLNNIIQDNTYMKDYICYQMMNEIGVASPLCSYAYITVNGEDWGLYLAVEGVEESFLQRNYGKNYGELYKPDSSGMGGEHSNGKKFNTDDFASDSTTNQNGQSSNQNTDIPQMPSRNKSRNTDEQMPGHFGDGQKPDNMTHATGDGGANKNGTMTRSDGMPGGKNGDGIINSNDDVLLKYIDDAFDSYPNIFDNAKTNISVADKTRLISALKKLSNGEDLDSTVDIDAVIRYFVVHNFVLNFDSYTGSMVHNYYLYEENGQLQMIPWDYNLAFGGFKSMGGATSLVNYPIDSPVSGGNVSDRPMIAWIFENKEYTELYHQYFSEFISNYFCSGYFGKMIDNVTKMISPYVKKDPTKFCTHEEFEKGTATLKEFCLLRAKSISGQLDGTIGATSDTQNNDTLVDAGNLKIDDMGTMNNAMGDSNVKQPVYDNRGDRVTAGDDEPFGTQSENPGDEKTDTFAETSLDESDTTEQNDLNSTPPPQFPGNIQSGEVSDYNYENFGSGQTQDSSPLDLQNGENIQQDVFNDGQMQKSHSNNRPNNNGKIQSQVKNDASAYSWIVIIISILVLGLGLAFTFTFKRHK